MRIAILCCLAYLCASSATAQTLQTVTANGNTTNQWLQLTGANSVLSAGAGLELHANPTTGDGYVKARNRAAGTPTNLRLQDLGGNTFINEGAGNVGIGTTAPGAKIHVAAVQAAYPAQTSMAKFTQTNVPATDGYLSLNNATFTAGFYIPNIVGRTYAPGRTLGLMLTGEADDLVPPASDIGYAAVVLDGRSKAGARLTKSDVLAVCSYGQNLMLVKADGSVGINATDTKGYKLAVGGSVVAEKMVVKLKGSWPDYVFADDYKLPSLAEVAAYVQQQRHLPDMPAAEEVAEKGLDLGEMNKQLLKKVEELTLYLIEEHKKNQEQETTIKQLQQEVRELKK
jgi:hypothetical protein